MQEEENIQATPEEETWSYVHPWLVVEDEDDEDMVLRFSLDEIRF